MRAKRRDRTVDTGSRVVLNAPKGGKGEGSLAGARVARRRIVETVPAERSDAVHSKLKVLSCRCTVLTAEISRRSRSHSMSHSVLVVGGRYRPPARFCDRFHAHTNIDFPLNDFTCPLEKS